MVVAGLLAAMFIGALDVTVAATATPHIIADLQGESLFSWVFAIYTLTTCMAMPIFGKRLEKVATPAGFCFLATVCYTVVYFRAVNL
jgi:MFS family permease